MTRPEAINLAAVALKAAHLTPTPQACAVLGLALLGAPEGVDPAPVLAHHLAHAVADLRITFPCAPDAFGAALLAAPGVAADLTPKPAAKPKRAVI